MLISEDYRKQNAQLHKGSYGEGGASHAKKVSALLKQYELKTLLDYGCGKGNLISRFQDAVGYDPAIPKYSAIPTGTFDLVTCTDVLEHIEPECLDAVLKHIASLGRFAFLIASTKKAKKRLSDGRNAHLIVKPAEWWVSEVGRYFKILDVKKPPDEVQMIGQPL